MSDPLHQSALAIFEALIGFDTTSRHSNLELIAWVEDYLRGHDISSTRVTSADGGKANLFATAGPMCAGGVILSGHSDVVPVDGQDWRSDPFALTRRGDRYFGRGTCDMKGFIALALAAMPVFRDGARPVHLAISYDEEVGLPGRARAYLSDRGQPACPRAGDHRRADEHESRDRTQGHCGPPRRGSGP